MSTSSGRSMVLAVLPVHLGGIDGLRVLLASSYLAVPIACHFVFL